MGVKLCRTYTSLCAGACSITGFALIRMVTPEGWDGVIYDTQTQKSYPKNHVCVAQIDDVTGTWESSELPFSDHLSPQVYYSVTEILSGSGGCDCTCGATDGCGCEDLCTTSPPTCDIFLSSTGGLIPAATGCNDLTGICTNAPTVSRCDYFKSVYETCIPPTIGADIALMHINQNPEAMPWYAPRDGVLTIDSIATLFGGVQHSADLYFEVVEINSNTILYGDFIAGGTKYKAFTGAKFNVLAGSGFVLKVVGPNPVVLPTGLNLQIEFQG